MKFKKIDLNAEQHSKPIIHIPQLELRKESFQRIDGRLTLVNEEYVSEFVDQQLSIAALRGSNFLMFPELCVPAEKLDTILDWSTENSCLVVAGSHYQRKLSGEYQSISPIVFAGKMYEQTKCRVAPSEKSGIAGMGVTEGSEFPIFINSPVGSFANFICADYLDESLRVRAFEHGLDFANIIAFQSTSIVYHDIMEQTVKHSKDGVFLAFCNPRVEPWTDGESSLFGVIDKKNYRQELVEMGLTSSHYENMICRADRLGEIICEVDMQHKRPSVGRTQKTSPNFRIIPSDEFSGIESGETSDIQSTNETIMSASQTELPFSAYIIEKVHNEIDEFRKEIQRRLENEENSIDPHTLADDFATRLSQSVYYGQGHAFVFKADSQVTNIQYAELLSLLHFHTHSAEHVLKDDAKLPLQFFSTDELRTSLSETWVSQVPDQEGLADFCGNEDIYNNVAKTMLHSFQALATYSMVVDFFDCSAVVFPAPGLAIDFQTLVRQAGFVHSCGPLVYVRNTKKTSVSEFETNLLSYLNFVDQPDGTRIPFCMYSHEIFNEHETEEERDDTARGMSSLKFHSEKFFFGGRPIYSVRDALLKNEAIRSRVCFIASGRGYHKQFDEIKNRYPGTLWIFKDQRRATTKASFFICYHEELVNADPFLNAEEDKPGWLGPVTMPHSLASAMFSLTRPYFATAAKPTVIDPFLGSGTTLFEAYKMFPNPNFWGGDLNLGSRQSIQDNTELLAASPGELHPAAKEIESLLIDENGTYSQSLFFDNFDASIQNNLGPFNSIGSKNDWASKTFRNCARFAERALDENNETESSPHTIARSLYDMTIHPILEEAEDLKSRLLVYCYWKAVLRNASALIEERRRISDKVFWEIRHVVKLLKRVSAGVRTITEDSSVPLNFLFSQGVQPDFEALKDNLPTEFPQVKSGDGVGDLETFFDTLPDDIKAKGADIIITDPPYGFNTDPNSTLDLLLLYEKLIERVVDSVGKKTHLLMCLPEQSHNGQILPSFVTKRWFVPRLLQEATARRIEVVEHARVWPEGLNGNKAPYFWRSEKALTRSIIHVILRR